MPEVELKREGAIAYREAIPQASENGDPVLLVHGFPQSSYMWVPVLAALAASGRRAIAPDLSGYGDSPPDPPGTWEHHVSALETFRQALGLKRVVLGLHDWGGLIGLRWGCDHPDAVSTLILSKAAGAVRTPGQGEQLVDNVTKQAFATMMRDQGGRIPDDAMDEYWKAFMSPAGRRGMLELYRSGDFEKLQPYEGQLEAMGAPALILWGENDPLAPVAAAHRFNREIPDSQVVILEGASHFLYDDEPARCAREIVAFLDSRIARTTASQSARSIP